MAIRTRKKANHRSTYGLFVEVGLVAALLLLILAFRLNIQPANQIDFTIEPPDDVPMIEIPPTNQTRKPPPPPRPRMVVEVDNDVIIDEDELDLDPLIEIGTPLQIGEPPEPEDPPEPEEPDPPFFVVVEEMPELIGSLGPIKYPEIARRAGIEGTVTIQFILDENGHVTEAKVLGDGVLGGCNDEALRVVRQARFRPGKQRGKTVKVQMELPITFRLR